MFKRLCLLAAAISMVTWQGASAADLPIRAPVIAPIPILYNWTGCYVGANLGGAWGSSGIDIPNYPSSFNINTSSVIGGPQIGCNYMFPSRWVVGAEADWSWMDLSGDAPTVTVAGETFGVKWDQLATLRGRIGYAWDRLLVYATGGAAWTHLDAANYTPRCVPGCANDQSAWYGGWTVGAGFEYALTLNWILGVEYLHAGFDSKNFVYNGPTNIDHRIDLVRARVSYKFW